MWYLPYLIYFYCMTVEIISLKEEGLPFVWSCTKSHNSHHLLPGAGRMNGYNNYHHFKRLVFCLFDENRAPVLPSFIENVLQKGYINTKINALKPLKLCSRHATLQFSAFLGWPHIVLFSHSRIIWACFRHL